jgi:hypothetical protein
MSNHRRCNRIVVAVMWLVGCGDNGGGSSSVTTAGSASATATMPATGAVTEAATSGGEPTTSGAPGTTGEAPMTGTGGMSGGPGGPGGTGGNDTTGGADGLGCQHYVESQVNINTKYCPCAVQAGVYADVASCVADRTDPQAQCRCDAYAEFPEADASFQCQADAAPKALDCLDTVICTVEKQQQGCMLTYDQDVMKCPQPSAQAEAAVAAKCGG